MRRGIKKRGFTLVEMVVTLAISAIVVYMVGRTGVAFAKLFVTLKNTSAAIENSGLVIDTVRSKFFTRMVPLGYELQAKSGTLFKTLDIDRRLPDDDMEQTLFVTSCTSKPGATGFHGCGLNCPNGQTAKTSITVETLNSDARTTSFPPPSSSLMGMATCFWETDSFLMIRNITVWNTLTGGTTTKTREWGVPKETFVRGDFQLAPKE